MPTTAHGRAELDARYVDAVKTGQDLVTASFAQAAKPRIPHAAPVNPLAMRLENVTHLHLNLSVDGKGGCHRPDVSIWPAADEDAPPAVVTMLVGSMFGQQARYLDMAPDEARALARHLINTADLIDRAVAQAVPR